MACYQTARQLDFFQVPLIRALIGLRGLPQRLVTALTDRRLPAGPARPRLRLGDDLAALGFIRLGETPGVELVWGQVSRPWKPAATSTAAPCTVEEFAGFDQPGFAKIAFSLRVDPYGREASILTMETRVALTDDQSRRRFRRYWLLVGPFSTLIRRTALRQVAAELSGPKEPVGTPRHRRRGGRRDRPKGSAPDERPRASPPGAMRLGWAGWLVAGSQVDLDHGGQVTGPDQGQQRRRRGA